MNEATIELEKNRGGGPEIDRGGVVWVELHVAAKQWELVLSVARPLCEVPPENESAWIAWASALREVQRVKEAEEVLLNAEPLHGGKSAVLHYNLACYACRSDRTLYHEGITRGRKDRFIGRIAGLEVRGNRCPLVEQVL